MFGKNNKTTTFGGGNLVLNLLGDGTEVTGNIESNSDIRIDGIVNGNVNTSAKLVLGSSGKIKGDVIASSADISGQISGHITINDILVLKNGGKINGDITTNKLVIESGSDFNGNCKMQSTYE